MMLDRCSSLTAAFVVASQSAALSDPCVTDLVIEPTPDPPSATVARLSGVSAQAPDDIWAVGLWRDGDE